MAISKLVNKASQRKDNFTIPAITTLSVINIDNPWLLLPLCFEY